MTSITESKLQKKQLRCPHVLVTGAAGFAGKYLVKELLENGHAVSSTDVLPSADLPNYRQADLCDKEAIHSLVRETQPDAVIHLGAISFVPDGDSDPSKLLTVNIAGTVNIAEAIYHESPASRMLFISTSQVYGALTAICPVNAPIRENAPLMPATMYAISKVAAEHAAMAYGYTYGIQTFIARPANHTGPGQSLKFVTASFVKQIVDVKHGKAKSIKVGNLESVRDFTDVRDVVRAYRLIIEHGQSGQIYNIAANTRIHIGGLLERLQQITKTDVPFEVDPKLYRKSDASLRLDISNLIEHTDWAPEYSLDSTLSDMISVLENNEKGLK